MSTIQIDRYLQARPKDSGDPGLDQAMLRAYSIERSVDYGCALEDVLKLRRRVEDGAAWVDICQQLAKDNLWRARYQENEGQARSAAEFYLYAAACLRLAQAALEESPRERLAIYAQSVAAFGSAMRLLGYADTRLDVSHAGRRHGGWLFQPAGAIDAKPPCVVVWGGADGWCEAFYGGVSAFLEHGLAVCLVELPGQGLARLRHESYLGPLFTGMVSATLDVLTARGLAADRYGVAGHSLGGTLAMAAAAADTRIRAVCTNGGSVDFSQALRAYPRVARRIGHMMGPVCGEAEAQAMLQGLNLPELLRTLSSPILCLQGGKDILVTDKEVDTLMALRAQGLTTLVYWAEGIHCINNNSVERNRVIAAWFAGQLHGVGRQQRVSVTAS
ncbi:alpha/beta hydrolase family protein [Herbaspirillum lusitanum]|uniref:alpha/beta hydrolase family protein n=1 Tax=Herbaspirillum lusitanum TaxID=213312 RepID=UPI0002E6819B|nr:alpha/beta hydrolase [Herbaspirillum lusitanum]